MSNFIDTVQIDEQEYSILDNYTESCVRDITPIKVDVVNLFDKLDPRNRTGMYLQNGKVAYATDYFITHPIRVNRGTTYIFNVSGLGNNSSAVWTLDGVNPSENIPPWGVLSGQVSFTPDRTGYIMLSSSQIPGRKTTLDMFMFTTAENYTEEYVPHKKVIVDAFIPQSQVIDDEGANITPDKTTFCISSVNIFNKDVVGNLTDTYFLANGEFRTASGYGVTGPVAVSGGKTYEYPRRAILYGENIYVVYVNGADDLTVKKIVTGKQDGDVFTFTAPESGYVRFNVATDFSALMITEAGKYPDTYVAYGNTLDESFSLNERQKLQVLSMAGTGGNTSSPLLNKAISFNGDSICAGAGYAGGYGKIIAERNNMTYQNIGVGGGTITAEQYVSTTGSPRHWISRTIANMSANSDYAIVEGGVNDSSIKPTFGTITSGFNATLDDTTFCGAMESVCKQLLTRFAGKKVGFIIVHKCWEGYTNMYTGAEDYYATTKEICEKWGVPYLDLNTLCPPMGSGGLATLRDVYTHNGDGWHPNEAGYKKYYCDKIEAWLKTL